MTREQARACFDRALDGELDPAERRELDALLERDEGLRRELDELEQVVKATRALHHAPSVDLLSGVQSRLRERSGGRFYRDRFAERHGRGPMLWMLAAAALVLVAALAWVALDFNLALR